jgi:hypothetical protein
MVRDLVLGHIAYNSLGLHENRASAKARQYGDLEMSPPAVIPPRYTILITIACMDGLTSEIHNRHHSVSRCSRQN